jgi:hypothetical protein
VSDTECGGGSCGTHLLTALLAESIEALAAQLQQPVALVVAAEQAVMAISIGGDASAGEHPAHHAPPRPEPALGRATRSAGVGLNPVEGSRTDP